ncbi:MAG: Lrp/AsnC family transcriptional regulator [Candidatus Hermodarchaeia archaeon]
MDAINKGILKELEQNCRTSYEALAQKYHISATAIRQRISRLIELGVIERFLVRLSHAMTDTHPIIGFVESECTEEDDPFIDQIGRHPMLNRVRFNTFGSFVIYGEYSHAEQLAELRNYLQGLPDVNRVELHPYPAYRGQKVKLSDYELRVLPPLLEDARLPITEIAKNAKTTAKRVSRTLQNLITGKGVEFTALYNLVASDSTHFVLKIEWEEKTLTPEKIVNQVQDLYPLEFWLFKYSAIQNLMWISFNVDHPRNIEPIATAVRELPSLHLTGTIIPYPGKRFSEYREIQLRELVQKVTTH